ncbi:Hpr(Ser) kinase/phosphatase [Sulfitobacter pontiacus]|jgi:HPr kinase/phosphorylase|uniref:Hpr(Ser) kinase/phosphatase n=1 Tax=Sulfitobacter pontiacus TaxID=60137 RepID=A0A1H3C808_9RHOB|nr:HPr kinase/phosphatase C-terminal domain-containing protein [Sulfitobacter pontiacus]SDX49649.1 Hpr(Ser) kinase/phosphatase [Sulfitobacter pontiacus]
MTKSMIHATTVAIDGRGVMIRGGSGKGKSALALQMIAMGAELVADDRTDLIVQDAQVIAHPPAAIKGLIEARGVGLLTLKHRSAIPIFLIVDLDQDEPDRLPEITYQDVMGIQIRCLKRCDGPHFAASVYLMAKMMKYTADD